MVNLLFSFHPEVLQLEIGQSLEIVLPIYKIIAALNLLENMGKEEAQIESHLVQSLHVGLMYYQNGIIDGQ